MNIPPKELVPPNPNELPVPKPGLLCPPKSPPPVFVAPVDPKRPPPPSDVFVPPKPLRVDPKPVVPEGLKLNPGFDVAVPPNKPVEPVEPNVLVPNVLVPEFAAPNPNGFEVAPKRPPL